jgi:hypothetical protein
MSEIVIIITRISSDNEWNKVWKFGKNEHCICICTDAKDQWKKRIIDLNNDVQTISQEVKAIIFNGDSCDDLFSKFDNLISTINLPNERDILMAIHTGGNSPVSKIEDFDNLEGFNYEEAITYSSPEHGGEIKNFADAINATNGDKDTAFSALKAWIKKKIRPHLIALSILCQGYLVICYESEERNKYMEQIKPTLIEMGWIDENRNRTIDKDDPIIKQNLGSKWSKVQETDWWYKDVFDVQNDETNSSSEKWDNLKKVIASECGKDSFEEVDDGIKYLFGSIVKNEKVEPPTVTKAYCAIAKVLENSTLSV